MYIQLTLMHLHTIRNAFISSQLPILLMQSTIVTRCKDTMYYVWYIRAVHLGLC